MAVAAVVTRRAASDAPATLWSDPQTAAASAVTMRQRLLWIGLAAIPSSLMLGVTAYLSTDIAAVPLLWVLPCALYLVTLIVPFSRIGNVVGRQALMSTAIIVPAVLAIQTAFAPTPATLFMCLQLAAFVAAAMACHTVLASVRPDARHLTGYYVCIALGGTLGGALNSLIAPWAFQTVLEYPLMLLAALILPVAWVGRVRRTSWRAYGVAAAVATMVIGIVTTTIEVPASVSVLLLVGVPLAFVFATGNPGMQAGVIITLFVIPVVASAKDGDALHVERSFFGVHRVVALEDKSHVLQHGTTIHGRQMWREGSLRREPVSYYGRSGPFGDVDAISAAQAPSRRVGVAGLGSGVLAAYARPADRWTFYEIESGGRTDRAQSRVLHEPDGVRPGMFGLLGDARISLRGTRLRRMTCSPSTCSRPMRFPSIC